ncbi:MAG: MFS transporter [Chloroflexi bacterium]|nr:MFS transporter [Chloroflexota bacterium]
MPARWLSGVSPDGRRIVLAKSVRAFGDGFASIAFAAYLSQRGFDAFAIGVLATVALLGTTAATLVAGFWVDRIGRRRLLLVASCVSIASGLTFATVQPYALLLLVAFLGTLNPSQGDVSIFLPVEQAALTDTVAPARRTWLFARYNLAGRLAAATGALASGLAGVGARLFGLELETTLRLLFVLYAVLGGGLVLTYRGLTPAIELAATQSARRGLHESRAVVTRLSALFALDSFGGGLAIDSVVALWLFQHYGLSVEAAGAIFFVVGVLAAGSMLVAVPLAARIGLIETMAYTHLPSNVALLLVPLAPSLWLALLLLFIRSALSQMDVAPRTTYIVSVVTAEERAAAVSVTNVVRSLSTAVGPSLGGALLTAGPFGLPLVVAGAVKGVYDVSLLLLFRRVPVRDEQPPARS